jgi:hypothetical protein
MRLKYTSLIAIAVLAFCATAMAATTTSHTLSTTLKGSPHLASGGKLTLITSHKRSAPRVGITIRYDVKVRSKTVLAFAVHPCLSTSCSGQSESRITLGSGLRHVKFHGNVPFVKRSSGNACFYAQLRDLGPKGKGTGTPVKDGSSKGIAFCQNR